MGEYGQRKRGKDTANERYIERLLDVHNCYMKDRVGWHVRMKFKVLVHIIKRLKK